MKEQTLEKQIKSINDLTRSSTGKKDKYYVYALFEKGEAIPFYIGKGESGRIFSHKAEVFKINIENLEFLDIPDEELEKKVISNKINTILKNKGEIEHVIVKFGLTNQEAFVAESALINLFNFSKGKQNKEKLTNIVSGHRTDLEKELEIISKDKQTKARTVENFITNYPLEEVCLDELSEKIIVIKINKTYRYDDTYEDVYERVRGVWNISENKIEKIDYVLAAYNGICVGVYKPENWIKASEHTLENPFPKDRGGEEDIVKYNSISDLKKNDKKLFEENFKKDSKKFEECKNINKIDQKKLNYIINCKKTSQIKENPEYKPLYDLYFKGDAEETKKVWEDIVVNIKSKYPEDFAKIVECNSLEELESKYSNVFENYFTKDEKQLQEWRDKYFFTADLKSSENYPEIKKIREKLENKRIKFETKRMNTQSIFLYNFE